MRLPATASEPRTDDDPDQDQDDHNEGQSAQDSRDHAPATATTASGSHDGHVQPRARHSLVPPPWKLLGWWQSWHLGWTGRSFRGLVDMTACCSYRGYLERAYHRAQGIMHRVWKTWLLHHKEPGPPAGSPGDVQCGRGSARNGPAARRFDPSPSTLATSLAATQ